MYKMVPKLMIRLLDLPGIARLEDRVTLYGADDAFRRLLVGTCVKLFGAFVVVDTEENRTAYGRYDLAKGVQVGRLEWRLHDGVVMLSDDDLIDWDDGEPFPQSPHLPMAEDLIEYLLTLAIDLRKDNGQPLEITQPISLTAECAARALHGCKVPDIEDAAAEKFGLQIQHQARNWRADHQGALPNASAAAEALFKTK
jgi:hypothetical protein